MSKHEPSATPTVNVILMLRDHLPSAIRERRASIARMESQIKDERAALEILIRHAAVEQIHVDEEEHPPLRPVLPTLSASFSNLPDVPEAP